MRDFPKMLYRADGAKLVERIVADEAALVAAQGEGFGDYAEAKTAARSAAAPAPAVLASGKAAAPASTVIVDDAKVKQLEAALAAERDAAASARELADAAGNRIVELETFLGELRDDDGAPQELRDAISKLLGDGAEGEAAPAATPKPKATRKKAAAS